MRELPGLYKSIGRSSLCRLDRFVDDFLELDVGFDSLKHVSVEEEGWDRSHLGHLSFQDIAIDFVENIAIRNITAKLVQVQLYLRRIFCEKCHGVGNIGPVSLPGE